MSWTVSVGRGSSHPCILIPDKPLTSCWQKWTGQFFGFLHQIVKHSSLVQQKKVVLVWFDCRVKARLVIVRPLKIDIRQV